MNKMLLSVCAGIGMALSAAAASADTKIDAGRLTVTFKESDWRASAELPYNQEINSAQGTFRGKGKVFTLSSPEGAPLAVMYVGATYGQNNVFSHRGECGNDARFIYIHDLNESKLENFRCVFAGGPYASPALLKNWTHYLNEASRTVAVALPEQTYFTVLRVTARGGLVIQVEALLSREFVGLPDVKAVAEVPALLLPGLAPWADKLAQAAVKALTSFSGELVVPRVEFSNATK